MPQTAGFNSTPMGYSRITPVVPSDTLPVPPATNALFVGGAGNVAVLMRGATVPVVLPAVAGVTIPISPARVMATGTTATGIAALG
jgi:hypothetical protein